LDQIAQINPDESVVIALGGNLAGEHASCEALLERALASFGGRGLSVVARSGWWRSAAWPDPAEPPYVNGVALVETALDPEGVLAALHAIERAFGRERGQTNASRTLDLDLIAHGRTVLEGPGLVLPHPRAHERKFVMGPLAEIAPGWRHPVYGGTARLMAAGATVGRDAHPLSGREGERPTT
jgi:2-amino-4-hydroxy-6-hydroxymethyldihydropteridine diphosphokinase